MGVNVHYALAGSIRFDGGESFPPGWKARLYGSQDGRRHGAGVKSRPTSGGSAFQIKPTMRG
jgi:hypothetical protein